MWQAKYTRQQLRINVYKQRIQKYQTELIRQREENEQTIENFTQLCQDLKFRGMDEVEDLQSQIKLLQEQLNSLSQDKAELQFQNRRKSLEIEDLLSENEETAQKVKVQREKLHEYEVKLSSSEYRFSIEEFEGGSSLMSGSESALILESGDDNLPSGGKPGSQITSQH